MAAGEAYSNQIARESSLEQGLDELKKMPLTSDEKKAVDYARKESGKIGFLSESDYIKYFSILRALQQKYGKILAK
jgi:hypothetical protein